MRRPDESESPAERMAATLRQQGTGCRELGSPLYADLLAQAAGNLLSDGPVADVLDGYLTQPASGVLPLRMLGAAHALALTGQAPELAAFYPSAGGTADPGAGGARAWAALRRTLREHCSSIREWLPRPPQTNEAGRGAALVGGLRHIVAEASLPIGLVEVGARAGLNLRADHFHVPGPSGRHAAASSPVVPACGWQGTAPPEGRIEVAVRTGGDLDPIDPATPAGGLTLTAFIWPDQRARLERLRGGCPVTLTTWPGGRQRVLGMAPPHGIPVTWGTRPHSASGQ